ncbi:zinc finger and BTB domain-containing protein 7B isoform X2 [Clupea harengus]|nr:zinc finger and BTB domain-containing protein 7B isoform X2 [Clupea harengus]
MSPGEDGLIGIPFPEHSSDLLSRLNAQRRAGLLCDLTLTSRGLRYPTHRSVMAAVSLYFRRLFGAEDEDEGGCEGAGVGNSCSVCQLDCVAPDALDALLEFAYTATLTIRSSGMREVLKGAQLLGIQCVADACRDILGEAADEAEPEAAAVATEEREAVDCSEPRVSRRKRDRRHAPKAPSPARPLWRQVQEPPPTLVSGLPRPSHGLSLAPTPGRDEHQLHHPHPAGYNGDAQGGQRRPLVNGGAHWHQEGTLVPPAADDAISDDERRLKVGVATQAPPPITERAATAGGAGPGGRKRKSQTPQQCPVCQKIIHGAGKLPRHMRTHTGEKPFQCIACGVRFTRNDKLKIHMRKHTGERPYPCPKCNARFLHSYDLKNHLSLHSGARPFECPLCHKAFAREDHLQRHRKGHSCLELRTRRPRRASGLTGAEGTSDGGGAGGGQQEHLEAPLSLQGHPGSSPGLAPPLVYHHQDPDGPQHLPLQALPLLGHRMPFTGLWRGVEGHSAGLEEEGAGGSPSAHPSRPPPQGRDEDEEEEEEEGEDEGEEEEEDEED